jgi:hypothetical protein
MWILLDPVTRLAAAWAAMVRIPASAPAAKSEAMPSQITVDIRSPMSSLRLDIPLRRFFVGFAVRLVNSLMVDNPLRCFPYFALRFLLGFALRFFLSFDVAYRSAMR